MAESMEGERGNRALLRRMLKITAPRTDVDARLAELRERVTEELDYRREARNQQMFARFYAGHPTIGVPGIVAALSTRRVVTSDLADGARFAELAGWSQAERDLAAETIYRFVFRSLYQAHAFNGDPHPGNYLFHGRGRFALLGELAATAAWRGIAEEIWPFVQGPPCTPMGEAEAAWRASRPWPVRGS